VLKAVSWKVNYATIFLGFYDGIVFRKFEIEIFCNSTVKFYYLFNVSLLNKSSNFFKNKLLNGGVQSVYVYCIYS